MNKSIEEKVIVAIPAYNEEKYIGTIILGAKQFADEVIVVNDGSKDCTSNIARLAGAQVIEHKTNKGKGSCIQTILTEARKKKPDVLIIMDGDGQHYFEEIPRFIKTVLDGNDLVIGSRNLQKNNNAPLYRKVGQTVLLYLTNFLVGNKLTDTESGFRALSQKAVAEIQVQESGFSVETEMIFRAKSTSLKITEVPICCIYTGDGSTLNPVHHGLQVFSSLILMISAVRLLPLFWLFGIISIGVGALAFSKSINIYDQIGRIAIGTTFAALFFIILGVQSIFTGILLKRLSQIMDWNH